MKILVTAGNTQVPIDRVRCITSVFTGRTGAGIALEAARRRHSVTLLTSHAEPAELTTLADANHLRVEAYQTYAELAAMAEKLVSAGQFDAIIHAAAVGDYQVAGAYVPAPGTSFDNESATWSPGAGMADAAAAKISGQHAELWLRLTPTPKIIDQFRAAWSYRGLVVKFKLEVGVTERELLHIAESSRLQSQADLMVANTLEDKENWAWIGPVLGEYARVPRVELAARLLDLLEARTRNPTL
jgi:phosphopantothenoylcysteine synthetase/decarboxylase